MTFDIVVLFGCVTDLINEIPNPDDYGLDRLSNGGAFMTDGCAQALKMARELVKEVEKAVCQRAGTSEEEFHAKSPAERLKLVRVYTFVCNGHLRNTMCSWGQKHEYQALQQLLGEANKARLAAAEEAGLVLNELPQDVRGHVDTQAVGRAAAKNFLTNVTNPYAKGKGSEFFGWVVQNEKYRSRFLYTLERIDLGTRQDSMTECAFPLYMNRDMFYDFVASEKPTDDNKLEQALELSLSCVEVIAATRIRGILFFKVFSPLRFLVHSSEMEMGPLDMGNVYVSLAKYLKAAKTDPASLLLNKDHDFFDNMLTIYDSGDPDLTDRRLLMYRAWKERLFNTKGTSIDGETSAHVMQLAYNELMDPTDDTNKSTTPSVAILAQAWCTGMYRFMVEDPKSPIGDYLPKEMTGRADDGKHYVRSGDTTKPEDYKGKPGSNDPAERNFSLYDATLKKFPKLNHASASAIAQNLTNYHISRTVEFASRGSSETAKESGSLGGLFDDLHEDLQDAAMKAARSVIGELLEDEREQLAAMHRHNAERRKEKVRKKTALAVKKYVTARKYFGMECILNEIDLDVELAQLTDPQKLILLKEQIKIRVTGYGWKELKCAFSEGGVARTWEELRDHLVREIFTHESKNEKPEAAADALSSHDLRASQLAAASLGTITEQKVRIIQAKHEQENELAEAEVEKQQAEEEAEHERRVDTFALGQPEFSEVHFGQNLVGVAVEVLYLLEEANEDNEELQVHKQWLPGVITKFQDRATTHKRKLTRRNGATIERRVAMNWAFVEFEDGDSEWLRFGSKEVFNKTSQKLAWRFDLDCEDRPFTLSVVAQPPPSSSSAPAAPHAHAPAISSASPPPPRRRPQRHLGSCQGSAGTMDGDLDDDSDEEDEEEDDDSEGASDSEFEGG